MRRFAVLRRGGSFCRGGAAWRRAALLAAAGALLPGAAALAQGGEPQPIPQGPGASELPQFIGSPATPNPIAAPQPPRHPFMAPNGRSNIHDDAYMTDTYVQSGPLGREMQTRSTFLVSECASVTFDSQGRIVSVCVGLDRPTLRLIDPKTLSSLASFPLPPRNIGAGNPFTDVSGGGYFYLDHRDRAVVPTHDRRILVVAETNGPGGPGFALERSYDLTGAVPSGDAILSALPDWSGRIWFNTGRGLVGTVDPQSGTVRTFDRGEEDGNSFAVDDDGGVYMVSTRALYRFDAGPAGEPRVTWREPYLNSGIRKPGQLSTGSGTTPTLMAGGLVAITDNADPMNIVVFRRQRQVSGQRLVCTQPVFRQGESATDNSLIAAGRALVVENNYGYTGPAATEGGRTTSPGIERVDVDADGSGCQTVWRSDERAPSVVPKLSLGNGLVYAYTKDPDPDREDAWYFTALDFRTGRTVYKRLAGEGLGFNNHYAPVTIGPDGTAYVGVLGGLVLLRDRVPPVTPSGPGGPGRPAPGRPRLTLDLSFRRGRTSGGQSCARPPVRATISGADAPRVRRAEFFVGGRRAADDRRRPFTALLARELRRAGLHSVSSRATLADGRRATIVRSLRSCGAAAATPRFTG